MKREEKNILTRQKIIDSSIEEFGTKTYEKASLNSICKRGGISKGIIYHYFKDKDELYLVCVSKCLDSLIDYLKNNKRKYTDIQEDIKEFITLRQEFFDKNIYFGNIFANALLQPPGHLIEEIKNTRSELDDFNLGYYKEILSQISLKDDVSEQDAIDFFMMFQESFNNYFHNKIYRDSKELVLEHELKLNKLLKIMISGLAKEENK